MLSATIELNQATIEALPNYQRKTAREYSAACPVCGGKDRFLFWPDKGNYWCRRCELEGFVTDKAGLGFTKEDYERWREQEAQRKGQERIAKLDAIERLRLSGNDKRYVHQLTDRSFWYAYGLTDLSIEWYELGYTSACPTYKNSASYTIPVTYQGELWNIRHRLVEPPRPNDKYRPEMAGLPNCMFNADVLHYASEWQYVLVEGEVKAMVLGQFGFNAIGIPGARGFKAKWARMFRGNAGIVYVCLDPGADEAAWEIAGELRGENVEVRVCSLPVKPDDFFVKYGGTAVEFQKFLIHGSRA